MRAAQAADDVSEPQPTLSSSAPSSGNGVGRRPRPPRHPPAPPSIRALITLIVVVPIAAVAATLVYISVVSSRSIAEQLGRELVAGAAVRVNSEVRHYLHGAMESSDLYARRIGHGHLSLAGDLRDWDRPMLEDLVTKPDVASICWGNTAGDSTWLLRGPGGRLELGHVPGATGQAVENEIDPATGAIDPKLLRPVYHYDPRKRPWYEAAVRAGEPVWTSPYFWFTEDSGNNEIGTGYTRLVRGPDGEPDGVLVMDVTLGGLSAFLRSLPLADTGHVYIIDDAGLLVAASDGSVTSNRERVPLGRSTSPAARAAAGALAAASSAGDDAGGARRVDVDGHPARVATVTLNPYPGIDWRVVAVVPEASFLADATTVRRRSVLLAIVAVAGALILGLVLSRRLSVPLRRLSEHVSRVGAGDFDSRLELGEAREFQRLADETNRMAAGLRARMELEQSLELATHVQQSLLPAEPPQPIGLDVFGQSRYCDQIGGDYYDFIDVAELPSDGATFVALGDVTGHGIGAALLMATARASLRASAAAGGSLGRLMARVNDVLAHDARHGLFMTMALLVVDPVARRVRWASAGHDATIVYDPDADAFTELDAGEIPLGVMEGVPYGEYHHDLPPRAILIVGTDGIWESRNAADELFGKDRLRQAVRGAADRDASEIAAHIESSRDRFTGSRPLHDDVTFVVIKLVPVGAARPAAVAVSR